MVLVSVSINVNIGIRLADLSVQAVNVVQADCQSSAINDVSQMKVIENGTI